MAYRNKTYVCFDADQDIHYYRLLTAWNDNENIDFSMYNAHDINELRKYSNEDTIKRKLKERLKNSKVMIVLVGEKTKNLYKYVHWEMEEAVKLGIPLIAVNIVKDRNGNYSSLCSETYCPAYLKKHAAEHVPFKIEEVKAAIEKY